MADSIPAGWYPQPNGQRRYWDGTQWTEHVTIGDWPTGSPGTRTLPAVRPSSTAQARTGWFPDPTGRHQHRYWDGVRWTHHVHSNGHQTVDSITATPPLTGARVAMPSQEVAPHSPPPITARPQSIDGGLFTEPVLVVHQKALRFGSAVGYRIADQQGRPLGVVSEIDRSRVVPGSRDDDWSRQFQVIDANGQVVLTLAGPDLSAAGWRAVTIGGGNGVMIGQIVQETLGLRGSATELAHPTLDNVSEIVGLGVGLVAGHAVGNIVAKTAGRTVGKVAGWTVGKTAAWAGRTAADVTGVSGAARYAAGLLDLTAGHARFALQADGRQLGSIHTENVEAWDFRVEDPQGIEIARVTKTWAGWVKETFTNADHYIVQIHQPLEHRLRSLVIASALAIDLSLKQGDPSRDTNPRGRHTR